jgi:rhodanese-related sulfurtransferase
MSIQKSEREKSASQIVAQARQNVPEITVAQAREELDQGEVGLLLDVREPAEWEKGHIPGAVLAPRGMLEWYADPATPYAKAELTTKRMPASS